MFYSVWQVTRLPLNIIERFSKSHWKKTIGYSLSGQSDPAPRCCHANRWSPARRRNTMLLICFCFHWSYFYQFLLSNRDKYWIMSEPPKPGGCKTSFWIKKNKKPHDNLIWSSTSVHNKLFQFYLPQLQLENWRLWFLIDKLYKQIFDESGGEAGFLLFSVSSVTKECLSRLCFLPGEPVCVCGEQKRTSKLTRTIQLLAFSFIFIRMQMAC